MDRSSVQLAHSDGTIPYNEALERVAADPVIRRFGAWVVTTFGVECLATEYAIPFARIHEGDWETHVCRKTWVTAQMGLDFADACACARQIAADLARSAAKPRR